MGTVKKILVKIGQIQTILLMALVYYLIIGPMAILYQIVHREKNSAKSYWIKKELISDMEKYLIRQF